MIQECGVHFHNHKQELTVTIQHICMTPSDKTYKLNMVKTLLKIKSQFVNDIQMIHRNKGRIEYTILQGLGVLEEKNQFIFFFLFSKRHAD